MKEIILKPKGQDLKYFHLSTKVQDNKGRIIEGYASTRFTDRQNDVVSPKALALSMDLFMKNPVLLLDHDMTKPIGRVVSYQVTEDGLYIRAEILKGTDTADNTWKEIEFGARSAFSIGFIPRKINYQADSPIIEELELLEVSVVSIPANRESLFSIAKAFELGTDIYEKALPKLGWDKTKAQLMEVLEVIKLNYSGLPTEEKIMIEASAKMLQNVVEAETLGVRLEAQIESKKLQLMIEEKKLQLSALKAR